MDEQKEWNTLFGAYQTDFAPGFEQRVLARLQEATIRPLHVWLQVFKPLAISAAAAVALLLGGIYYTHQELSIDAILGTQTELSTQEAAAVAVHYYVE